jgi:hypothetical protein
MPFRLPMFEIASLYSTLGIESSTNPSEQALENAEVEEIIEETREIGEAEAEGDIDVLLSTVYKAAEDALTPITRKGYQGYVFSYIFI